MGEHLAMAGIDSHFQVKVGDNLGRMVSALQIVHRADAGDQQSRDLRVLDLTGDGLDPFQIGVCTEAVVETATLQAIAVRHLDRVDPRVVECSGDLARVGDAVLVADRVAAVTQCHVGDVDFLLDHCHLFQKNEHEDWFCYLCVQYLS